MSDGPTNPEFAPINPLWLEGAEGEAFSHSLEELQKPEMEFKGSRPLIKLIQKGEVGVGVLIRIWQTDLPEVQWLTHRGLIPYPPEKYRPIVMSFPFSGLDHDPYSGGVPYKWNIEGLDFIANETIDQLFERTNPQEITENYPF